jgi:MoaA/NifB/PqqE/SkfB family radical SAM enzyme
MSDKWRRILSWLNKIWCRHQHSVEAVQSERSSDALPRSTLWRLAEPTSEQRHQPRFQNKRLAQLEFATGETVLASRPSWILLDPGTVCNLRCVQCPRENPSNKFEEQKTSIELVNKVLAVSPYLERLSLQGLGEPLLSDVFWKIIEDENTKSITNIDINTNGTLLSDKNVDRLLKSNLKWLRISLDGATSRTYRKIRGGSLTKVVDGIRRLTCRRNELGKSDFIVWIQMTLMQENIRELPMMIDLGYELGTDALCAGHMHMSSDGAEDNWRLTHGGWTFVYKEQHLSNNPALSNEMVRLAQARADELGYNFHIDPELWLKE